MELLQYEVLIMHGRIGRWERERRGGAYGGRGGCSGRYVVYIYIVIAYQAIEYIYMYICIHKHVS